MTSRVTLFREKDARLTAVSVGSDYKWLHTAGSLVSVLAVFLVIGASAQAPPPPQPGVSRCSANRAS